MLKFSLIIPVYNEERHIRACLDAVADQTVKPDEVIVVDNNCRDKTIEIADEYDFVTVITETKQGRAHARNAGFNKATGDIIGRVDADSRIATDWVERVKAQFEDLSLDGITGLGKTVFLPGINSLKSKILSRSYFWFVHAGFNTITMWGANMAIRRSAWEKVKNDVCMDDKQAHEDQDISLWMAADGQKIVHDNKLLITTNGQSYRYLPKSLHYLALYFKTKHYHRKNGNLKSAKLPRLGFLNTLPGRIMSIPPSIFILIASILLFPVDYLIKKRKTNPEWLD